MINRIFQRVLVALIGKRPVVMNVQVSGELVLPTGGGIVKNVAVTTKA